MNLTDIIKKRGLTQKRLGEIMGIAQPQINVWCRNKETPRAGAMAKLAKALNCLIVLYGDGRIRYVELDAVK